MDHKNQPDPMRVAIVKMLPRDIKEKLTIEEMNALLYEEVLPDSLIEKLKDYLADIDNPSE
ncbi:MAG TPA: hypothetical protein PKZ17_07120 [Thermodesulfovibrio thiophilus]|uniref:hypothetical protein n=1 Tax=Thermodesulfovibrio thiophilus TaxID=340095 RepID=UPI0003FA56BB|nr:hypothetical protein [Thermodesulfovibrio thiophilus]HHW19974.1 hypothetical protein [Thermodesulfovibrio thiophilus]HOA83806.1 hypothetical protein [Thermodesulfovibrio thiophilus]HQA04487.1 hypothetical protein [Thermodesulfovibrio thiophilus]HQD36888.1 hypothetical protein [Thermodesulfovibrio thiophilus]